MRRKILSYPRVKEVQPDIVLEYVCPETGGKTEARKLDLSHQGGCDGNHGENGYCYCPPNEFIAEFDCTECGGKHKARLY